MSDFDTKYPNARTTSGKSHWPPNVRSISNEGLDFVGVDDDGHLYWDGRELATRVRLRWFELWLAIAAAVGTFGVFVIELGRSAKWWGGA